MTTTEIAPTEPDQAIAINEPATTPASFGDIPIDCLRASKTNPRKIFADDHLGDLAASIKKLGVAQPILVRPIETSAEGITYFEIVAGERRYRASRLAGMPTVPAIVRVLGDIEALEIQVIENLQRQDLHPLEEAEGYEVLMKEANYSADQMAEKVGKSKAYIYASLKLCALVPGARKSFYAGTLTKSTALFVARIPVKSMQEKCVKEITDSYNGPMSARDAFRHIERTYMLELKKAIFKPSDASLISSAGPCTTCPNRTGNQPEIFTDVSADVCTDPICHKAKSDAHVIQIKQLATASGLTVLSGTEAKKIMPQSYSEIGGGYVDLDKVNYSDSKNRTYRQMLGKNAPAATLLESPHHENRIIEIVKLADLRPALEAKGFKLDARHLSGSNEAGKAREKAQEEKAKREIEYRRRLFTDVHNASLMMNLIDADLRLVARLLFDNIPSNTTQKKLVMSLQGWTEEMFSYPMRPKIVAAIDALTPDQLNQFIRDCSLSNELTIYTYTANSDDRPENLLALAARVKVDAKAIRSGVDAEAKAKRDAKQKAADKNAAKVKPATAVKKPGDKKQVKAVAKPKPKPAQVQLQVHAAEPAAAEDAVHEADPVAPAGTEVPPPVAAWPFPKTPMFGNKPSGG